EWIHGGHPGGEGTPVWNSSPNVDNLGALVFSSMRRSASPWLWWLAGALITLGFCQESGMDHG
ncbi:hypothetical protein, partial [Pseudomonas aeruginosa]